MSDGERDDDGVLAAEEAVDFAERVVRVVEADEEGFFAAGAEHGSFELNDARTLPHLPELDDY